MSAQPEPVRPLDRRHAGSFRGGDPPRHRSPAPAISAARSKPCAGRVTELTDWRRQVREHRSQLIVGAAVAGFALGGLMMLRRRR